jgi:hypothetical protein
MKYTNFKIADLCRVFLPSLVLAYAVLGMSHQLFAQKNANAQDERRENQRVASVERALGEVKQELAAMQKRLRQELSQLEREEAALVQLRRNGRVAREDAEDRLGEKIGIPQSLKKVRDARAELDKVTAKVIDSLATNPDWKKAKEKADQARTLKKTLQEDVELDEDEREQKLSELQLSISQLEELERAAVSKDPLANKANETLNASSAALQQLRKTLPKDKIDADPKVQQIEKEIDKQEKQVAHSKSSILKSRMEAAKLQRKFVQAQTNLRNARAADASDSNKNKKNPKK